MMFTSFIVQLVIVLIVFAAFETIEAGPLLEHMQESSREKFTAEES